MTTVLSLPALAWSTNDALEELSDDTVYRFYSKQSGRCLNVKLRYPNDQRGYYEFTNIQIDDCPIDQGEWTNHEWYVRKNLSGFHLVNRFSKMCLGSNRGNTVQVECQDASSFKMVSYFDSVKLIDTQTGLCLKTIGTSNAANVVFRRCTNSISESWLLETEGSSAS